MSVFGGALRDDGAHIFPVRVYFEDTDFSGNVYHAAYLKFFERARTEYLRAHGIHHPELAQEGMAFAVREMTISYDRACPYRRSAGGRDQPGCEPVGGAVRAGAGIGARGRNRLSRKGDGRAFQRIGAAPFGFPTALQGAFVR